MVTDFLLLLKELIDIVLLIVSDQTHNILSF